MGKVNDPERLRGKVILSTIPADVLAKWMHGDVPPAHPLPRTRGDMLRLMMRDRMV